MLTRRSLLHSGLGALLAAPWARLARAGFVPDPYARSVGATGRPKQDDEIVLGVSAAFSGPSRGLGTELYRGAMAYFNEVNDNGGVNGRRIVLKLYDDGYQPDPCVANTISLMQDESVFLLFGYVGTPTVTRVLPLLKKFRDQQVYLFFPFTGAEPQREPPYGEFAFNLRSSYRQETAGLVDNFVRIGRRRVAVFYQNDAYGRSGWAGVREAMAAHGETMAGEATYTRGTQFGASMRRQVEILQARSPDAVICIGAYQACAAFARDAADLGLHIPVANVSFVGSENLLALMREGREDPDEHTRFLVNSQVVPSYEDTSLPAVREYHELMSRYDPPPPDNVERITEGEPYDPLPQSFVSLEGFVNAKLITEILRGMGDEPDRSRLEEAVFAVRNYDLGVGERVSFAPDRRQGMQRVYYTVPEGDRFVPLEDWETRFGPA
ncbi:MAG: ABC transporter substrate-binding protein [Gemmatimonadetes bacterium]|nr:ABC transporter substrate-binding protein [Gemmatimonadota bacterium]